MLSAHEYIKATSVLFIRSMQLAITDVAIKRGLLLLRPVNVLVLGGQVRGRHLAQTYDNHHYMPIIL